MKHVMIVSVLLLPAALAGCQKPGRTVATEIPVAERPAGELMPSTEPGPSAEAPPLEPSAPAETAPQPVQETAPPAAERTYVVQPKDTLWSIARKVYGDPKRWKDIAAANGITDETKLPVGKVLKIPE